MVLATISTSKAYAVRRAATAVVLASAVGCTWLFASADAAVVATHSQSVTEAENNDAMSVCELAYATAKLIEVTDPAEYGETITARAVHNLSPTVPLSPPGHGLGWLVGANANDPSGHFTYRITCASATQDLFRLVVVDQFEQFTVESTVGSWTGPHGAHGRWSGSVSDGRFVMTTSR
jgi:hypothetical protein